MWENHKMHLVAIFGPTWYEKVGFHWKLSQFAPVYYLTSADYRDKTHQHVYKKTNKPKSNNFYLLVSSGFRFLIL